ncbi:multidrug resistance-associated protein 1-like [Ornithodoros turicata]|uniref:multidrug resistance-associated protein 1-like n=1 Tax=Ornithodoros turicata TaxID=34597 RepID=UPI0031386F12
MVSGSRVPFCSSPLWDWNLTWFSDYFQLTPCFESTVLVYIPSFVLFTFGLPTLFKRRQDERPLSITVLSIARTFISVVLVLLYGVSFIHKVIDYVQEAFVAPSVATLTADVVRTIAFSTTVALQTRQRNSGQRSSSVLFSFWFTSLLCRFPEYFRCLQEVFRVSSPTFTSFQFGTAVSAYPLIVAQFVLSCFNDSVKREFEKEGESPSLTAAPLSSLTFEWVTRLILLGYKRYVTLKDLFGIRPDHLTRYNYRIWNNNWEAELRRVGYSAVDGTCRFQREKPSLFYAFVKTFWFPIAACFFFAIVRAFIRTAPALLINLITNFMASDEPMWKGVIYACAIVITNLVAAMFVRHIEYTLSTTGLRIKAAIMASVYRKALRMSNESQGKYTVGELVNFVSVDADRVYRLTSIVSFVAAGPVLMVLTLFLLWQYLGPSSLAGVAVMIVMMPLSGMIVSKNHKLQTQQMKFKDKRLKTVGEMLSSIKVLKLFAWEPPFMDTVNDLRSREVEVLKRYSYLSAVNGFFWTCTPSLVTLSSFVTYVMISDRNILDPSTAFVSLALFNQMRYTMVMIPDTISNAVQTSVSFNRLRDFLLCSEIDLNSVGAAPSAGEAITVRNATLCWSEGSTPVLRDINFKVDSGRLFAIVGPVGSGKSSLLSSLLGDLRIIRGSIDVAGSVGYVPQQAWIQNKTIRDNIVFMSLFEEKFYEKVLGACSLEEDMRILPAGDMTEIGEKGINLSGGQKQRVSLARAAYQKKDLYLFDDPLSAVDAHVASSIFRELIGPKGMLRATTRVLVTNNLSVLPDCDYIYVLKEGRIAESGSYAKLRKQGSALSELLKDFVHRKTSTSDENGTSDTEGKGLRHRRSSSVITDGGERLNDKDATLVQEEGVEVGSIKLRVYLNYMKHAGPWLVAVLLGYILYRILDIVNGIWLSAWATDAPLQDGTQDIPMRNHRIVVFAVIALFQGISYLIGNALLWKVAIGASTKLHALMLRAVMRAPLSFFDVTPSGRLLNRFGKDVDQLDIPLPMTANFFLDLLFNALGMIGLVSSNLTLYVFIAIPVLVLFAFLRQVYVKTLRQVKRLESVTRSPVYNHLAESATGLSSIRGYRAQDHFSELYESKVDITQNCTLHGLLCNYWMQMRLEILGDTLILGMLLLVVFSRETVDAGTAGLLVSYSLGTVVAFNYLIYFSTELEATIVAAERIEEYSAVVPEAAWERQQKPTPDWPYSGSVIFSDFYTKYRDNLDFVLKGVDLSINPAEKVGVVGRTGAGKSSLSLSLFRIIEASRGRIWIDNLDISDIGLHDLRSRLTIIPQDPVLFEGSLRFNLDPTRRYKDDELWLALERAHLKSTFKDAGLGAQIQEGGMNLSVGQRQLVCLARAVLRRAKVLVLDEATAAVDLETDALIQDTIKKSFAECTTITIAHRLHTILDSDRVVVMDAGKVVECGKPGDLLKDQTTLFFGLAREAGVVGM